MPFPDMPQTELAIVEMTNAFRAEQRLAPVRQNPTLAKAAKAFADYLARTGQFGHTVDGRQPVERTKEQGYKHCIVAENLALNEDSRGFETRALADQAVTGWKNSPPHRAAMLHPHVTEIGVGIAKAPTGNPKYLSVQLFGRPDSLKYTFRIENYAGASVPYKFDDKPLSISANSIVTQTACVPGTIAFDAGKAAFKASDGVTYRLSRGASGTLEIKLTGQANQAAR